MEYRFAMLTIDPTCEQLTDSIWRAADHANHRASRGLVLERAVNEFAAAIYHGVTVTWEGFQAFWAMPPRNGVYKRRTMVSVLVCYWFRDSRRTHFLVQSGRAAVLAFESRPTYRELFGEFVNGASKREQIIRKIYPNGEYAPIWYIT